MCGTQLISMETFRLKLSFQMQLSFVCLLNSQRSTNFTVSVSMLTYALRYAYVVGMAKQNQSYMRWGKG